MENFIEHFCHSRDYGSVSKKLKAENLLDLKIEQFVSYVKQNRGKRKSTLSFEVSPAKVIFPNKPRLIFLMKN